MICPYCGTVDESTTTPAKTPKGSTRRLGECCTCDETAWAYPTNKSGEPSPLATVRQGESREEALADTYVEHASGHDHRDRRRAADIDREVVDASGSLSYFLEIKERSCSINGYRKTMFPYAKIDAAMELIDNHGVPVHVVLKFVDCWAREIIDPDTNYERGEDAFFPGYRPSQANSDRQVPVKIPVDQLEVLDIRDGCETLDGSR